MNSKAKGTQLVYAAVSTDLRERIFRGELGPGDVLPSESELCAAHNASRETIRKGLKQLETEGLIFSRPRRGYFVSAPQHNEFTLTFSEEIENCWSKYRDVRGILPDKELQKELDIPADKKVIEFSRITYSGEIPVAFDVKYLPYDRAYPSVETEIRYAVFPEIAAAKIAPFDFYTRIAVCAIGANEKVAEILECDPGEPLLLITRNFIRQDGQRIGYNKRYVRQPYGKLEGTSGYRHK
jgi:GntR family transcriptional regulator